MFRIFSGACCVILGILHVTTAHAASLSIEMSPTADFSNSQVMTITDQTGTMTVRDEVLGIMDWAGSVDGPDFSVTWDLTLDPDPGVSGTVLITNNTATTQFYAYETGVISSVSVPAGGVMRGSSTITVGDTDLSGTSANMQSLLNDAIYSGRIQGVTQRTLFPNASLTAPGNGTNFDFATFGPEPTFTTLPVNGLLSLRHAFRLTAGDTATALSTFIVEPPAVIPVPAAVWLFGSGLLGLVAVARRKK